jgi:hypothetical protein
MKRLVVSLALTLALLVGSKASAIQYCVTGCGTSEPCDGYCVESYWLGCGEFWAIVQECQPYQVAQLEPGASSAVDAGVQPHFRSRPTASNPAFLAPTSSSCPAR